MSKRDAYHHGDLRAGLVEAVRSLVEAQGPDRFSVADACRIAGVSTAAPYRHFADRDAMLKAVALEGIRRQRARMEAAVAGLSPGTDAALVALGHAYVGFARAEPGVFRLMFGLTKTHGGDETLIAEGTRTYAVLLAQIAARTGLPPDAGEVMRRSFPMWTFVHGLSFLWIDEKVTALKLVVDMDAVLRDFTRRMLADLPEPGTEGQALSGDARPAPR